MAIRKTLSGAPCSRGKTYLPAADAVLEAIGWQDSDYLMREVKPEDRRISDALHLASLGGRVELPPSQSSSPASLEDLSVYQLAD